jgi:hypothetical protein
MRKQPEPKEVRSSRVFVLLSLVVSDKDIGRGPGLSQSRLRKLLDPVTS